MAQDKALAHIDDYMKKLEEYNEQAIRNGGVVIAGGMSKFNADICVATVFDRADQNMYYNKKSLKSEGGAD